MFLHIRTSMDVDAPSFSNLHDSPLVQEMIQGVGQYKGFTITREYQIHFYKMEEIAAWDPVEDKFFIDHLTSLLVSGRARKQYVIIQQPGIDFDLNSLPHAALRNVINANTIYVEKANLT